MRIGIVNDLQLAVEALRRVVLGVPGYRIAWVAKNGAEAVEKCARDVPDLILMNLVMPVMDGVEATRRIMEKTPCAILLVTDTVAGNAGKVFEAMGCGALDAVCTPVLGSADAAEGAEPLLAKMRTLSKLVNKPVEFEPAITRRDRLTGAAHLPPLVAIGASTGGPKALAETLGNLPSDFSAAIIVIQHVDVQFAPGLADWLGTQCRLPVKLADKGSRPQAGTVLVAGSNDHLVFNPDLALRYTAEPRDYQYRPSVDAFFRSAAEYWPRKDVAALLTGMGRDGAQGLLALRRAGWHTIAQDRTTSVLYGMPKAAVELEAAVEVLPLAEIAPAIIRVVSASNREQARPNNTRTKVP